jgi:hypothetical protein
MSPDTLTAIEQFTAEIVRMHEEALALLCAADEPVDFLVASALDSNPA